MIYLDNAATTFPKPPSVVKEALRAIHEYGGNPGRSSHALSLRTSEKIYEVREKLARFLGASFPENIIFTQNATYALNMAIKGYVRRGMHILISNREHNAVLRPIVKMQKDGLITYSVFDAELPPEESIAPLQKKESAILVLNHVSNVDGHRVDLASYLQYAREHRFYTVLDASQSLGHLPLDLRETPLNALCAPCHKGLYGIQGAGFAYFDAPPKNTWIEGGSGSHSLLPEMPDILPERMEAGTLPTPAILAVGAGIDFLNSIGINVIEEHEKALLSMLVERLSSLKGIQLYLPEKQHAGGILSFTHSALTPEEIAIGLDRFGIATRAGLHCAPLAHSAIGSAKNGTVRVSFGYYNTAEDVEALYKRMKMMLFLK